MSAPSGKPAKKRARARDAERVSGALARAKDPYGNGGNVPSLETLVYGYAASARERCGDVIEKLKADGSTGAQFLARELDVALVHLEELELLRNCPSAKTRAACTAVAVQCVMARMTRLGFGIGRLLDKEWAANQLGKGPPRDEAKYAWFADLFERVEKIAAHAAAAFPEAGAEGK